MNIMIFEVKKFLYKITALCQPRKSHLLLLFQSIKFHNTPNPTCDWAVRSWLQNKFPTGYAKLRKKTIVSCE